MSEYASAIDDSYGAVPWPDVPNSTKLDNGKSTGYIGPREGSWEVSSSVGSFIDDRCPTVHGYPSTRKATGHVHPMGKALAHRLMKATIEEKEAAVAVHGPAAKSETSPHGHSPTPKSAKQEVKKPKAFILPRLRETPKELHVEPAPTRRQTVKPSKIKPAGRPAATHAEPDTRKSGTTVRHYSVSPPRSASGVSQQSSTGTRTVRLLGKHGEEAFVQLPARSLTKTKTGSASTGTIRSSPLSAVVSLAPSKTIPSQKKSRQESSRKEVTKELRTHDANHTNKKQGPGGSRKRPIEKHSKQVVMAEKRRASSVELNGDAKPCQFVVVSAISTHHENSSKAVSIVSTSKDSGIFIGSVSDAASKSDIESLTPEVLSIARKISKLSSSTRSLGGASWISGGIGQFRDDSAHSKPASRYSDRTVSQQASQTSTKHRHTPQRSSKSPEQLQHVIPNSHSPPASFKSAYRPPTVQSAESSSSVEHGFDGFPEHTDPETTQNDLPSPQRSAHVAQSVSGKQRSETLVASQIMSNARTLSSTPSATERRAAISDGHNHLRMPVSDQQPPATPINLKSSSTFIHSHHPAPGPESMHSIENSIHQHRQPEHPAVSELASISSVIRKHRRTPIVLGSQTNFAGTGWISPHPLSPAATQSMVPLAGDYMGTNGTLSYEEWKAKREVLETVSRSMLPAEAVWSRLADSRVPQQASQHSAGHQSFAGMSYHSSAAMHPQGGPPDPHSHDADLWALPSSHGSRQSPQHQSQQQQASVHTHVTARSRGNFSFTHHTPGVPFQQSQEDFPPQVDGSASNASRYSVGFTPNELDTYQDRLVDTVSRHSARFSQVNQMQTSPQPDYSAWDRRQSSSSRSNPQQSPSADSHPAQPHRSEEVQLPMPWDLPASVVGTASHRSTPQTHSAGLPYSRAPSHSSHRVKPLSSVRSEQSPLTVLPAERGFPFMSRQASLTAAPAPAMRTSSGNYMTSPTGFVPEHHSQLSQVPSVGRRSSSSQQSPNATASEATFGTGDWQHLDKAEQGQGGFQSRQGW